MKFGVIVFPCDGGLVLGICNGFQVQVEASRLPGALIRNRGLKLQQHNTAPALR